MFSLKGLSFLALLAIEMPFPALPANPPKMAAQARFDLTAKAVNLTNGTPLRGGGRLERMNWVPAEAKNRGYTANFAVTHYSWSELAVRFIPDADGTVELKLMGPREETAPGELYREEILWDKIIVTGSSLSNGSFEQGSAGWSGGTIDKPPEPLDGSNCARTWHNSPMTTTLSVTKGVPVVLTLFAKAAIPEGFQEMRRFSPGSSGFLAAAKFQRGANLGNYLEAPPGQDWGMHYGPEDFAHIKTEGFDHVRIPVAWHHYTTKAAPYTIDAAIIGRVDFLVTNALANRLAVIVNIHHFDPFTTDPAAQKEKFYALWKQIAAHYAAAPDSLAFELLNEPKDKATTSLLNPIYAEAIRLIRQSNPRRTIFLGPGKWNSIDELPSLQLPDDDENLIVTVHCYDPFYFTHQGASWAGPDTAVKGIIFPGPPPTPLVPNPELKLKPGVLDWIARYNSEPTEKNPSGPMAFRPRLERARDWSRYYGRPIHVGEFGAYVAADPKSRANFYRDFAAALGELKLGWAIWDWKAGFAYWDQRANAPLPGMREALFGGGRSERE